MSTVTDVRVTVVEIPRSEPVSSAYATYTALGVVVVEVIADSGAVGQGWTNLIGGGAEAVASFVRTEFAPIVLRSDPTLVRDTWERMYLSSLSRGRAGLALYALSAVDLALWDLRCRQLDAPLHAVLGASRDSVAIYGDGCWVSYSDEQLRGASKGYADRGFWGVKVKVGADPEDAIRRVQVVREAVGPGVRMMIDANQGYDLRSARDLADRLADEKLAWFEEPLRVDLTEDYASLTARSPIPIAAGENTYTRYGFRDLLAHRAVDIIQPDVHRVGGVTEFMRIAALAESLDIPVAPHTSWEIHSQLLTCVATGLAVEYYDWFPDDVWGTRPDINGGMVRASQEPGLGARLSTSALQRFSR